MSPMMNDQRLKAIPDRSALGALRQVVDQCGIYWTLTALAEIARKAPSDSGVGEKVAKSIEQARNT